MNNYPNFQNYYNPNMGQMTPNMSGVKPAMPSQNMNQSMPNPQTNYNFNKCNYVQQSNPNNVYDVYAGFIRGNMFPDLYNQYKVQRPFDVEPMNEQARLLTCVDSLCFAAHDLNLYLDTHPQDKDMIELFNQYRVESNKAIQQYESQFGPLFVDSDASMNYPWAWNQSPWPWENQ